MKIIRRRLYLFAMLLIVIVFLGLSVRYSYLNKRIMRDQKLNMERVIEQLCHQINDDLKDYSQYLTEAGEQIATEKWTHEWMEDYFRRIQKIQPSIKQMYFADTNNYILVSHEDRVVSENLDLRKKDWYVNAVQENTIVFTNVHIDEIDNNLLMSISKPVYNPNKNLIGVVAMDVSMEGIIGDFVSLKAFQGNQKPIANTLSIVFIIPIFSFAFFVYLYDKKIIARAEELEASYGQLIVIESELREQYTQLLQSEKELRKLSYNDQLTGLYNRRFFEEELSRLDHTENLPLTIIMADVNGLKLINDSFGHKAGDELLETVARIMKEGCRKEDIAARIGGDEFVVILPKTSMQEAEEVVSRLRKLNSTYKLKNKGLSDMEISVSFGIATKYVIETSISEIFKVAEDNMYKNKLAEGPSMRSKAIDTILKALYELSKTEELHSQGAANMAEKFCNVLGLPEDMVKKAKKAGLLHDIGKIAISKAIWGKPGELDDLEMEEMKKHPEIGYRILNTVNEMSDIAEYVLRHHERYDGLGYPKGLKGEEIPLMARIITIVSAYDAMATDRVYKKTLSHEQIIEEYKKNAGTQFDPYLAEIFVEKVLKADEVK